MQKVEEWNGHAIRFVFQDDEYWAVAKDVTDALGLKQVTGALKGLDPKGIKICGVTNSKVTYSNQAREVQNMNIINEKNIYRLVFKSRKPEAEAFQDWVFEVIKELRQSAGLEIFQMLDREHQKEVMAKLTDKKPVNYIKANQIANKATSNAYGFEKSLKKGEMTQEMLVTRQNLLSDTVDLMNLKEKYDLDLSVSQTIYNKDHQKELA